MSPTRRQPTIHIYQDLSEQPAPLQPPAQKKPRPQLAPSAMPLQPTRNTSQTTYAPAQPGMPSKQHLSPVKSLYPPLPQHGFTGMDMIPTMSLPDNMSAFTDSPQKRMSLPSSQPLMPAPPMSSQPMFTSWDSNFQHFDQENFHMQMPMPDHLVDFPDLQHVRRATLKRSYSETVPMAEKPSFKRGKQVGFQDDTEEVMELPQPDEMPPIIDDGQKPPYSYAQMIGMAILRSPDRRLTLANIYEWISSTFQFYRDDPKTGWHNSIRHNLSLNKAFIKQERPKSDAGKGCYWLIQPGMEAQFFKDKPRKSNNTINMSMQQSFSSHPTMQAMAQPIVEALQPQPWIIQSQTPMEPMAPMAPVRPQTAPAIDPALPELSSDATLPASDPALNDEDVVLSKEIPELPPPSMQPPPSSPPVINSSPPLIPRNHHRTISSPANITRHSAKQGKRTLTGMDDSGYFSSLESSARRPRNGGTMLTSELGFIPRKKVGRAEEEIARIRSSSHDITPSGRRFRSVVIEAPPSSSPEHLSPVDAPTTPPVVFKKPHLPPQSISPNTQLQRHRDAMSRFIGGSPGKRDDVFGGDFDLYSPAFKLGTPSFSTSFDDSFLFDFNNPATPLASSPIKPALSAKRSIQRSNTTVGVLSDVTKRANSSNKMNSKPINKIPGNVTFKVPASVGFAGSPLKKSFTSKTVELFNDENDDSLFDFGSFPDDNSEGEELDISKGFSQIGSGVNSSVFSKPTNGVLKPALSRSHTSRF